MTEFDYSKADLPIREDISTAHQAFWQKLAKPGAWWNGAERVAIAQESRNALSCSFCKERKEALSPYTLKGEHFHSGGLPSSATDAVHRIITDQQRITRRWVEENAESDLPKGAYVELVGIVVATFSIDEFHRALDLPLETLPQPVAGEPSGYVPAVLSEDIGYVPTIPADGTVGNEADLWPAGGRAPNVLRALTLVPDALRDWRDLSSAQYLSFEGMANFVKDEHRSINRMQMELVAGRVSAINQCFY